MNEERPLKMLLLVAVGAVLLSCAGVYVATTRWSAGSSSSPPASGGGEAETLRVLQEEVRRDSESRVRAGRTLAAATATTLLAKVADAREVVAQAEAAFAKWNETVPALMGSETGKRLAADPARVRTFHAVYNRLARPTERSLEAVADRLGVVEGELAHLKSDEKVTLTAEDAAAFESRVSEDHASAQGIHRAIKEDLDAVEALVQSSTGAAAGSRTLEAALKAYELELGTARLAHIEEGRARVRAEQNDLDRDMEAEELEKLRTAQREKAKALLEDQVTQEATAADIASREAKERNLKTRAEDPTVQANYQPFLSLGRTQPWNRAPSSVEHCNWELASQAQEKKPVSLSALRRARALDDFDTFVAFATSMNATNSKNDRGAWTPLAPDDEKARAKYHKLWEEFRELAPYWEQTSKLGH